MIMMIFVTLHLARVVCSVIFGVSCRTASTNCAAYLYFPTNVFGISSKINVWVVVSDIPITVRTIVSPSREISMLSATYLKSHNV